VLNVNEKMYLDIQLSLGKILVTACPVLYGPLQENEECVLVVDYLVKKDVDRQHRQTENNYN
jgi:hypothetical protein